jgi:tetratricopeptide (TPR) repeat protein
VADNTPILRELFKHPLLILISGALLVSGCAGKKKTVLRRMAITPTNVLVSNPAAEWMKLGVPIVLQQDLLSTRFTVPLLAASEANLGETRAQDILRSRVEDRQGRIHIKVTIVDVATQKVTHTEEEEASSTGTLIPALDKLAKRIDEDAGGFSTKNIDALKLLASAAQQRDSPKRADLLKNAIATDPNFGLGYFLLLEMLAPLGPPNYQSILDQAHSHRRGFTPFDQARFDLISLQLSHAPLSQRIAAAEALLKVAPNDIDGLAAVASIRFLNGDVRGALEAINHAINLSPGNPNLKQQLAAGLVENKHFAEAETVLAKFDNVPGTLPELATVILLEGDVARATKTAERFFSTVTDPDYQALVRASWIELAGDRTKAIAMAEGFQFKKAVIHALALSEATVWRLMNKDFAGARKTAELAAQADRPRSTIGAVAGLLVSGDEPPEEWRKKVEASPLNPAMRQPILAYGFFLNGHYREAAAEWRKILDASEGSDLRARAMLAASLEEAGGSAEVQRIKVQPFLLREFADVYGSVVFAEMLRLTGWAAIKTG